MNDREGEQLDAGAVTVARRRGARSDRPAADGTGVTSGDDAAVVDPWEQSGTTTRVSAGSAAGAAIDQAVFAEEATRNRGFSRIAMILVALVGVQMPWLGGDPVRQRWAAASLLVMFGTALWSYLRSSHGSYSPAVFRVTGWVLTTGILPVVAWAGFFSPITVVLSLGIYYLGQSTDRHHALLLSLFVTTGWVGGALLTMLGVLDERGLYSAADLSQNTLAVMVSGVGGSLLATTWLAQLARRSVRQAIVESSEALLEAQKRGALLEEAHLQLDRAMRLAVGKPGLHTGRLAGDYRLAEVIGIGAMGEVYAAEGPDGTPAAVKLLHPDAMRRDDMVVRFLREATLCTRFDHDSVVRVYDVGRMDDGAPYMVMERLQGEPLSAILRDRGHLEPEAALELAEAVGEGLAHAHSHGVVHRDLKPHNVICARAAEGSRWKILDFGISKLVDSTGTLTGHEGVLGTPAYMSPEQARGLAVDHRSDVFALGSVLYRALTGRPAFPGRETPRIMFDVAYAMPEQPSLQVPGLPHDLDLVLAVALAKSPEDRFDRAEDFVEALRAALHGDPLDPSLRAKAHRLLSRRPWGYRPQA
ncbi:MAG: serine/threonine-protein kinase [Myxococcales bacterium]